MFIDSFRLMEASLSNLADNFSERFPSDKCTDCKSYLDYMSIKYDQLIFNSFECKQYYKKDSNKDLIKRFANVYKLFNGDINKLILLLRKRIYRYEYIDDWGKFDQTLYDKKEFHSSLNMEAITCFDYGYAKTVFKYFSN